MIAQYILIALLAIYCLFKAWDLIDAIRYALFKKRMTGIIADKIACSGHLIPPDTVAARAYNLATGKEEYLFVEERNDDIGERMIFVSKDATSINVMPWRRPLEASDPAERDYTSFAHAEE